MHHWAYTGIFWKYTKIKLTIKTPKRRQWRRSRIFVVYFEHRLHLFLVFLLLTLNKYMLAANNFVQSINHCVWTTRFWCYYSYFEPIFVDVCWACIWEIVKKPVLKKLQLLSKTSVTGSIFVKSQTIRLQLVLRKGLSDSVTVFSEITQNFFGQLWRTASVYQSDPT